MNIESYPKKSSRFKAKLHLIGLLILAVLIFSNVHVSSAFTGLPESVSYATRNESLNTISSVSNSSSLYAFQFNIDFSTFFGDGYGQSIAVDSAGNSYVTGSTYDTHLPTKNAYDASLKGASDAFIAKFGPNGSLFYSSYFGGDGNDFAYSIAVDNLANSYIAGSTESSNFPIKNIYNSTFQGGEEAFIAKFNATGSLMFSTLLENSTNSLASSIALDNAGNIYIAGITSNLNYKYNDIVNFNSSYDVYVAKFNGTGSLMYRTILGNVTNLVYPSLTVDKNGNCFIIGSTFAQNFPITQSYTAPLNGSFDIFVAKLNTTGFLVFSTLLGGGSYDYGASILLTRNGNILVTGRSDSINFPTKNAYNATYNGGEDIVFAKLSTTGKLLFSTYLGGGVGESIAQDINDNYFVVGSSSSSIDFPFVHAYKTYSVNGGFIAEFNSIGRLMESMPFGSFTDFSSVAIDKANNIYITGNTGSNAFPIKNAVDIYKENSFSTIIIKFYPPLKVLVNTTQPPFFLPIISFLTSPLVDAPLLGGFIIALVIILEFYSYIQEKRKAETDQNKSFIAFLKEKLTKQTKKNDSKDLISARTFALLEKIEQENKEE